jgi:hypothetical protein
MVVARKSQKTTWRFHPPARPAMFLNAWGPGLAQQGGKKIKTTPFSKGGCTFLFCDTIIRKGSLAFFREQADPPSS